jgi:hypothetical protein
LLGAFSRRLMVDCERRAALVPKIVLVDRILVAAGNRRYEQLVSDAIRRRFFNIRNLDREPRPPDRRHEVRASRIPHPKASTRSPQVASSCGTSMIPSDPAGWRRVSGEVAPQHEADVAVRIAPTVRAHGWEETDGIRISGARSGTAKAILPVRRFMSDMDRQPRDVDLMSCGTRSPSDIPLGCVCACRAQREDCSNCLD